MNSAIRRRKRYFIKPGFQSRLTAIFILIVIIVANIVGALVYGFSIEKLENKLVVESKLPIDTSQLGQALLPGVIVAELVSILVVCIICIFVTHTIAGPVYRMERVARSIGTGDLTNFIKLRPKDELKDLADAMNEMTMGLRSRVVSIKDAVAEMRAMADTMKSAGKTEKVDELMQIVERLEKTCAEFMLERVEGQEEAPGPEEGQPASTTA